jgi:hypothetical protein
VTWTAAGVLLAFSVVVSVAGACDPYPPGGYRDYTAAHVLRGLIRPALPAVNEPLELDHVEGG